MANEVDRPRRSEKHAALRQVPVPLDVGAQWAWRIIVIGIVVIAITSVVTSLGALFVPLAIAILIAAPLESVVTSLARRGISRAWGAALVLLALIVTVSGLLAAAGGEFIASYADLKTQAGDGVDRVIGWLASSPFHVDPATAHDYLNNLGHTLSTHKSGLVAGALSVTSTVGALIAGAVIGLICLFFFLRDGRKLWVPLVRLFPKPARDEIDRAGTAAWATLAIFTKTSVLLALIDGVGVGLAAWLLGLPLAIPIAILVFLGSFIPVIGSIATGGVAVLVALVDGGWVRALIMAVGILVIQQIKGVVYPWVFGKAASIHPLIILISLSVGAIVAGIVGALLVIPFVSVMKAFIGEFWDPDEDSKDDGLDQPTEPPPVASGARKAARSK